MESAPQKEKEIDLNHQICTTPIRRFTQNMPEAEYLEFNPQKFPTTATAKLKFFAELFRDFPNL